MLVLALIPVFKPWKETIEWEYDVLEYTTAGIVSPHSVYLDIFSVDR